MRKKAISLALALVMCLGLTVPAFAETVTGKIDDITVTAQYNSGLTASLSYTGSGELTAEHAEVGVHLLFSGLDYPLDVDNVISVSIGQGLTVTDSWKEAWDYMADTSSFSVSFSDGTTAQPDDSQQPTDPEPTTPPAAEPAVASPTNDSLTADGVLQTPTVYKINGSNYFKIRDLAAILNGTEKQFSVGYDSELKSVTATTGEGYEKQEGDLAGAPAGGEKTAEPSNDAIYINGEKVEAEVYKIDGSNYFKLRDLGKALDFYVGYSAETGVFLETDKPYSE